MKHNVKRALLFALALLPVSLIAGYLTGIWQLDSLPPEMVEVVMAQFDDVQIVAVLTAVQVAGYALVLGFAGCLMAQYVGLWRPLKPEKRPLCVTLVLSLIFGIVFSLDYWTFGKWEPMIAEYVDTAVSPIGIAAAVIYGGVVEEVMLRLFFMTGIALLLGKVFCRKTPSVQWKPWVFIAANVIAALLFAAAHLPSTEMTFGSVTPLLLFRCFLLNGGFGLLFGYLYRKHGLRYAMLAHGGCHVVSKLIWILFL